MFAVQAVRDFSLEGSALEDAIAHVTNIEFQRESDDLKEIGVDWAQWHTDEYIGWLRKKEGSDRRWSQELQPSMQRIAVRNKQSGRSKERHACVQTNEKRTGALFAGGRIQNRSMCAGQPTTGRI
jgi:hypothetical protein